MKWNSQSQRKKFIMLHLLKSFRSHDTRTQPILILKAVVSRWCVKWKQMHRRRGRLTTEPIHLHNNVMWNNAALTARDGTQLKPFRNISKSVMWSSGIRRILSNEWNIAWLCNCASSVRVDKSSWLRNMGGLLTGWPEVNPMLLGKLMRSDPEKLSVS